MPHRIVISGQSFSGRRSLAQIISNRYGIDVVTEKYFHQLTEKEIGINGQSVHNNPIYFDHYFREVRKFMATFDQFIIVDNIVSMSVDKCFKVNITANRICRIDRASITTADPAKYIMQQDNIDSLRNDFLRDGDIDYDLEIDTSSLSENDLFGLFLRRYEELPMHLWQPA